MGVATDSMTASAAAPRYVVVTWIIVGLTGGYSAIGSRLSVIAPTMTVRMAITIATIGRRMKKSAITNYSFACLALFSAGGTCSAGVAEASWTGAPSRTFCI